eukprot:TRINITY_DN2677_c0_g1_i4.p1 TRINITY_DN2677_c0_g1~~TRINITY_DN2677_c0_g1_i4.p1  ORF type:complete len:151 (-),score=5.97 TRINITY_DN2677_c0_g1_i4:310-762(-)
MSCFCRRQQPGAYNIGPTKPLEVKLAEVKNLVQGSYDHTIVTAKGIPIFPNTTELAKEDELLATVGKMFATAVSLGEKLKNNQCFNMHIKGRTQSFSCFRIGDDKYLLFCTHRTNPETLTSYSARVRDICEDLRQLLQGHDFRSTIERDS